MPFDTYLTVAGAASAFLLVAGLLAGIAARKDDSTWRIWPAPPVGSLKSFAFWTFFRTLNVTVLALAAERILTLTTAAPLAPARIGLAVISIAAFAAYLYALWALGREATYCQASGLATEGVYRWTRNPQYATAIVAFGALGLAACSWEATTLAAALVLVYALMAIAEEPWLEARYGRAYVDYRSEVPRFFNLRHAFRELVALTTRKSSPLANGRREHR
jgi:protein-S-isoprenylcysteine O-methyltransferase Ste14